MGARGPQPGDVVDGKYRLEILIGTGGMGAVWSARVPGSSESVAVKFLHAQIATDPILVQRFLLEGRAGITIKHPNVIQVLGSGQLDVGADDPVPYLVMELLHGKTLTEVLRARPRLDVADAASLVADVTRGAQAAHEAGIVHRDIKPANVFLHRTPDGDVLPKILDFGISKFTEPGLDGGLTTTGMVIGSTTYMSPEQATGSRDVDLRSDIWSLGVLLYRLLTSESPLPSSQQDAMVALAGPNELPLVAIGTPRIPGSIAEVVRRCLRKKPAERFPSATALDDALRNALLKENLVEPNSLARLLGPATSSATIATVPPVSLSEAKTERDGPTQPTDHVMVPSGPGPQDAIATVAMPSSRPSAPVSEAFSATGAGMSQTAVHESPRRAPWLLPGAIGLAIVVLASSMLIAAKISSRNAGAEVPPPIASAPTPSASTSEPVASSETSSAPPSEAASSAPRSRGRIGGRRSNPPPPPPKPTTTTTAAPPPPPATTAVEPWRRPGF